MSNDDIHARTIPDAHRALGSEDTSVTLVAPSATPAPAERYERERPLGEGGMGVIFLCRDRRIGRRIALKTLREERAGDATARARFLREAQVQGQLEHPAVVPVYDLAIDADGGVSFTMKRVRGVTLAEILAGLREGREGFAAKYSQRRLLSAFANVCLAVDFAHSRGVVHRDLKPENVMLGDFGEVYVLDWGVARVTNAPDLGTDSHLDVSDAPGVETRAGALLGTPGFMSPEQVRGDLHAVGHATDVYALGAILFEILALQPLHRGTTIEKIFVSTLEGADARASVRAPDRDAPPELDAVCAKATALDARQRYASARELQEEIERYLDGARDVERRHELAETHANEAARAADWVRRSRPASLDARRAAMREIGRALALDPGNAKAMRTLVRLLSEPPALLPPEVSAEIEEEERRKTRWIARFGAIVYTTILLYVPFLLAMGARVPALAAAPFAVALCAAGLSAYSARHPRPSTGVQIAVVTIGNVAFALTSVYFGPLFFAPPLVAVNTAAAVAHVPPAHRLPIVALGCACVIAPIALALAHVVDSGYAFTDAGMTIVPHALAFPAVPTMVFLSVTSVALVLTSAASVMRIRGALSEAERRLLLYAWHLRAFAPEAAQGE